LSRSLIFRGSLLRRLGALLVDGDQALSLSGRRQLEHVRTQRLDAALRKSASRACPCARVSRAFPRKRLSMRRLAPKPDRLRVTRHAVHPRRRSCSAVALHRRPVILERHLHAAQHIDRLVRFEGHRIGRSDSTGDFERVEQCRIVFRTSADNDNDAAVVATRPPKVIVVMAADGRRQTQTPNASRQRWSPVCSSRTSTQPSPSQVSA
jgi:hypothetical protein